MLPTTALREALNASITSGHFADTKVYLFSHRNSAGEVCKPKVLYANSIALKSAPYFNDLFSGNYSEAATRDLDEDIPGEDVIAEHYDYDSDSDLEDAEDLKAMEKPPPPLRGHLFDPFCFAPDESDDSESKCDDTVDDKTQDTTCDEDHAPAYYEEKMNEGKVIKVQDVAFVTFQAFLLYLYTDQIEFAPFGSEANRKTRAAEILSLTPDCVPRPSPKSIYRLADKYDIPGLKFAALKKIKEGLRQCDAVRETFSRFASHYPEILKMHVENLASILTEVDSGEVQDQLNERLQAYTEGEIDHASEAFSSLWKILTPSGGGETARDIRRNPRLRSLPAMEPTPLKTALIKSIRQGSFCDRKYSAKRNNARSLRAPVYISSIVLGNVEPTLNTLIGDSRGSGTECSEDECDSDSDYEEVGGMRASAWEGETGGPSPEQEPEPEPEPAVTATLSTGAFSTALFFFLYTEDIEFAPLKSRGPGARMHYVWEDTGSEESPLCSPKSICYLAGKLGLKDLEDMAYENVAAKTSAWNVVKEVFSKSTARLPSVREMQCRRLVSSRNEGVIKAAEEHIRGLAGGQTPYRYAALSLGFKMAVEEKRKSPSAGTARTPVVTPPGPTLQCPNPDCAQKGIPMLVRDIGEKTACQTCRWGFKCCVCGSRRKPGRPNCAGCKKEWN